MTFPKAKEIVVPNLDVKLPFQSEMKAEVIASSRAFYFEKETIVFSEGENMKCALVLLEGVVRLFHHNHNSDRELMMYEVATKDPAKLSCVTFYDEQNTADMCAIAEPGSTLLYIPIVVLEKWADRSLEWNKLVIESFRAIFSALVCTLKSVGTTSLEERIMYLLNCRADRSNSDVIQLTHQQIANYTATSRVVVSRILKEVESRGEIELQHGRIRLLSQGTFERLEAFV